MNDNHIIDPGKLDTRIVVQTYGTPTLDSYGDQVITWATLATIWAAMDWKDSKESESSDQEVTATDVVAVIRYRSDIDTKMRVTYNSKTYEITGIMVMGRKRYQKLNLREVG
jgi:SPP1 family predicted phage head-tail adaptor